MPGGYRDEHITHYTRESLNGILVGRGFVHEETAYIARSELIMKFRNASADRNRQLTADARACSTASTIDNSAPLNLNATG